MTAACTSTCSCPAASDRRSPKLAAAIRAAVDDVVARYGGSYSAEHGLGPVNAARWLADTPPIEQRMIAALKSIVDPQRLLGHPGHPYNLLPVGLIDRLCRHENPLHFPESGRQVDTNHAGRGRPRIALDQRVADGGERARGPPAVGAPRRGRPTGDPLGDVGG